MFECRTVGADVVVDPPFGGRVFGRYSHCGGHAHHRLESLTSIYVRVVFAFFGPEELVTELVSRHLVVTCYRVLSDLRVSCNPRFWPKNAL